MQLFDQNAIMKNPVYFSTVISLVRFLNPIRHAAFTICNNSFSNITLSMNHFYKIKELPPNIRRRYLLLSFNIHLYTVHSTQVPFPSLTNMSELCTKKVFYDKVRDITRIQYLSIITFLSQVL